MSKDDRRRDEKERLWNEVLNKPRTYESTDASQEIELTINANEKVKEKAENTKETLKRADLAMDELNKILKKQQKDLENLSNEMKKRENETIDPSLMDLDQLEKDIRRDYGVEEMKSYRKEIKEIEPSVFEDIYNVIISKIMGQKDAMKLLVNAFRRPYVMGELVGKPRNVILISGPEGSGRHEAVTQMARSLYEKGVFISDEVYTIDMSRYTSGSQETIFLQDLYQALQGKGSVICFEHFENGFPAFLRMIDSLVTDGKVVLNKRYVLSKGVLVENQTGLVTSSVDSLSAEGKYLIFITTQKPSKVQDAFGADFMYHVLDTVILKPLDEESVKAIIAQQADALTKKAKENLKTDIEFPQELQEWVAVHYDKTQGADSISAIFYDFYVSLAELVLHSDHKETDQISLSVRDDVPYALCHGQEVRLSRSKNSQEEIDAAKKKRFGEG